MRNPKLCRFSSRPNISNSAFHATSLLNLFQVIQAKSSRGLESKPALPTVCQEPETYFQSRNQPTLDRLSLMKIKLSGFCLIFKLSFVQILFTPGRSHRNLLTSFINLSYVIYRTRSRCQSLLHILYIHNPTGKGARSWLQTWRPAQSCQNIFIRQVWPSKSKH